MNTIVLGYHGSDVAKRAVARAADLTGVQERSRGYTNREMLGWEA